MLSSSTPTSTENERSTQLAEWGWRTELISQPDGTTVSVKVPLTALEFLHPQEGYHLPNSTFHDDVAGDAKDLLTRRYANNPEVGVFRDLLIGWDIASLEDHCPDTFVACGTRNKTQIRTKFIVANEGVRPVLIVEVVSPRYCKQDRETKVIEYAQAGVQEYVVIDRRTFRKQVLEEVLGYRLVGGHYQSMTPDENGRILCDTVGLWISLQEGHLVMEDAQTGERLKNSQELTAENQEVTAENQKLAAENQDMAVLLDRYRDRFGNLPEDIS